MANYDLRQPIDYRYGQITAGVTSLDTTLTSPAFASLPADLSAERYLAVTLADDSLGVSEVVWVTGHTAGSSAVTVMRGREGSTARAWSAGTVWRLAPLARDTVPVYTRATLPTDAHLGMRAALSDELETVTKTSRGWAVPLGGGIAGRRHAWNATGFSALHNATTSPTEAQWVADSGNGSVAIKVGNGFRLRRAGIWCIRLYGYTDSGFEGQVAIGGGWNPQPPWGTFYDKRSRRLSGHNGQMDCTMVGTGYVTQAEADGLITPNIFSWTTNSASVYATLSFSAEYLGG